MHISRHGAPGEPLLETADGRPDRVTAAQLAHPAFTPGRQDGYILGRPAEILAITGLRDSAWGR